MLTIFFEPPHGCPNSITSYGTTTAANQEEAILTERVPSFVLCPNLVTEPLKLLHRASKWNRNDPSRDRIQPAVGVGK